MTDAAQAWAEAFTKAQSEFPSIHKDKTAEIPTKSGGKYSYKYADLPTILEQVNPILKTHGLAIGQAVVSDNGNVGVETRIYHSAGHVELFGPLFLPGGDDARSAGSGITYARRYSLCAALGIATDEDDDGATAAPRTDNVRTAQAVAEGDPYCPACLHVNGEKVEVWRNDKRPFWKCKNKPEDCAGAEPDQNGKLWSWSGWDESFDRSAQSWLDNHPEYGEEVIAEQPEVTPKKWLADRVGAFKNWTSEESRQAYYAVMEDLDFKQLSSVDRAQQVFDGMSAAYFTEFPDEAPF